jgi:hypothetical protein
MMNRILVLCFCLLVGGTSLACSQEFPWTLTTVGGEVHEHISVQQLRNDTLFILRSVNFSDIILVDSLASLHRIQHAVVLPAIAIGAVAGGAVGYSINPASRDQEEANIYGGVFGSVIGAFAGYLIGSLTQSDERVVLKSFSREKKREAINAILK